MRKRHRVLFVYAGSIPDIFEALRIDHPEILVICHEGATYDQIELRRPGQSNNEES